MSKLSVKASKLIPFLNLKNKTDVKFREDAVIERKEMIFNSVETVNDEDSTVWGTISSQNVDRTGDVVVAAGCDTSEFKNIPSVYVNHDYSLLPIAKCEEIVHGDKCIKAKIKFITAVPAIRNIFELVKAGALKGISVGFDSNEVILRGTKMFEEMCKSLGMSDEIAKCTKRIISKWKLYEFSIVSIPANADCFVKSLKDSKFEVDPELTKYLGVKTLKNQEEEEETPEHEAEETPAEEEEEDDQELDEEIDKRWKAFSEHGKAKEKGFTEEKADKEQLKMGMAVEMEHTTDADTAKRIALDHLAETPDYYSRLEKMEDEAEHPVEEAVKSVENATSPVEAMEAVVKIEVIEANYLNEFKTYEDFVAGTEEYVEEMKPFPNEHAARQESPDKYSKFRRQNDKFGAGLHAIWGITDAGKTELQSIRASASKFTVEEFRKWLKDHDFKTNIEAAKKEPKRYINVLQTTDDEQNLIQKSVEARLKGKTRLEIKIV